MTFCWFSVFTDLFTLHAAVQVLYHADFLTRTKNVFRFFYLISNNKEITFVSHQFYFIVSQLFRDFPYAGWLHACFFSLFAVWCHTLRLWIVTDILHPQHKPSKPERSNWWMVDTLRYINKANWFLCKR